MPPKRTPPRARTPKVKTPKMPEVRTRDSSVDTDGAGTSAIINPAGLSPEFMAFMQMQEKLRAEERAEAERIRAEERVDAERLRATEKAEADRLRAEEKEDAKQLRDILENQRKDDLERTEQERFEMNKAHEAQLKMLQEQLAAMSARPHSSEGKSHSKMPIFDIVKDKETFKLWKSRWDVHVQGHKFDKISDPVEKNVRLRSELNSCLSDSTISWLLNNGFSDEEVANAEFVLKAMEQKANESANPVIQQIEMSKIVQGEYESGDHLCQRIRELANKCAFEKVTNYQDHYSMITLLRAVKPQIRKKMLLQKVDSFDKAMAILLSEEQAVSDAKQCSGGAAEAGMASAYKKNQRSERQNFEDKPRGKPDPDFVCPRCNKTGHWADRCFAKNKICQACEKVGHYAVACRTKNWNSVKTPAQANSIKAYLAQEKSEEQFMIAADRIGRAKEIGHSYSVMAEAIEGKCSERDKEYIMNGAL